MSAQPKIETVAEIAPIAGNPIAELKPLLNPHGELDIANLQFGDRIEKFQSFIDGSKFNLPMWATNLLAQFPPNTTLLPLPVYPAKKDAWRGADANKMGLKPDHVEPSADFIINLGNLLGVQLRKVFEGPVDMDGKKMYSIRYNAYLMLPNGAMLTVEDEGKDQPMLTNSGSLQAHIVENTRKKAKRNAIKSLLAIPTSMLAEEFDRPWVLLRPVFRAGSPETDRILAEQAAMANESRKLLYSGAVEGAGDVIDVVPTADQTDQDGEIDIAEMITRIKQAATIQQLSELATAIKGMRLTGDERDAAGKAWQDQKKFIEEVAAQEQQGF